MITKMKRMITLLCAVIIISGFPVYAGETNSGETVSVKFQIYSTLLNYVSDYQTLIFDKTLPPEKMFEKGFKAAPLIDGFNITLKQDVVINSIKLNGDTVDVDFNEAFEKHGYGSGTEGCMISAVVNTLGNYYGVKKIRLTVNSRSYTSGHLSIEDDDIFYAQPFKNMVYTCNARTTDEGLQDDYIYQFYEGEANPQVGQPIFLVNGVFLYRPQILILNGYAMTPAEFLTDDLGVTFNWNKKSGKITLNYKEIEIIMSLNEKKALVNGVEVEADAAPVEHNGAIYLPLRFIAENVRYSVGFYNEKHTSDALAYNPIIWLDRVSFDKSEVETADTGLELLKEKLYETLENCKNGMAGDIYEDYFLKEYPRMNSDIEKISYTGQIGRFAIYKGYRLFLVDTTSNEIYYAYMGNTFGGVGMLDVNDTTFFHGYFAG